MRLTFLPLVLLLSVACGSDAGTKKKPGTNTQEEQPAGVGVPQDVAAIGVSEGVSVSWSAVAGVDHYVVGRAAKAGGPYDDVGSPTDARYDETGLTPGDTFYYVVRAVKGKEESKNSGEVSATVRYPAAGAPVTVAAVSTDGQVQLFWGAGARAVSYRVDRVTGGVSASVYTGTARSTVNAGLINSTSYSYTVSALNEDGLATPSTTVTAVPYAWGRLLCVTGGKSNAIYTFPADVSGAPAPVRTISGPSPLTTPTLIALDAARSTMLVHDDATNEILTFSTANDVYAQPLRRLRGAWTSPLAITVDTFAARLFVLDTGGTVYVYPVTDAGAGTPVTTAGVQSGAVAMALDPAHGEVFTADSSSVMARSTTSFTLVRNYNNLTWNVGMRGLAYAPSSDLLAVVEATKITLVNRATRGSSTYSSWGAANWKAVSYSGSERNAWILTRAGYAGSIQIYRKPVGLLGSDSSLTLSLPVTWSTVAADGANDRFWMVAGDSVKSFSQAMDNTSTLATAPLSTVGSQNGLNVPAGLASDPATEELYVLNEGSGTLAAFPWTADGSVNPSRTVQITNGPAFSGLFTLAPGQNTVFAAAGTNSVVKLAGTSSGTIDWSTATRIAETPEAILGLTYDAVRDRLVGHMRMSQYVGAFGFWSMALGDAIESFASSYSLTYAHPLAMSGDRIHYATDAIYHFLYYPGSSVNYTGPSVLLNTQLGRSTVLIDERNNELLYGMGGKVYTLPKVPSNGQVAPTRILDVSSYTGVNVSGLAFCSQ